MHTGASIAILLSFHHDAFPMGWAWCRGLPVWLLSSSLYPHSPVKPDHEHSEPEECELQLPDYKGGATTNRWRLLFLRRMFLVFLSAKDGEMMRQLDWINIGIALVWLAWLVYLPVQFFPCSDPLLFLNILNSNRQVFDPNDQGVVDPRINPCCCLLFRVLVKERELHPINAVLAFSISGEILRSDNKETRI